MVKQNGLPPCNPDWSQSSKRAVQVGRGRSPALVKQNGLPPMHPGWSQFSKSKYRNLCMWSKELIELSKEYLNCSGVSVKTQKGDFGILDIDHKNKVWTINLLTENTRNLSLVFHSADELIKAGWAVD
ncbi:MAG: hypothetical protein LBT33_00815 [Spirochaetia bacterium]|nr:hypothetical protein [Spirochaetia bacterium]